VVASLRSLVEALGSGFLEVVVAPRGLDVEAGETVIHDPTQPLEAKTGDVVLGVGVASDREGARLVAELGRRGAAALLVRAAAAGLAAEAERAGIALVAVHPAAPWGHVVLMVSSIISRDSLAAGEGFAGADPGDLFSVANIVSELVDAPVTIEDPRSRVLAFSGRQEEADEARVATILGRKVPSAYRQRLLELGVFRRLAEDRGPVYIDSLAPGVLPRVAIAIRAGEEVLGSIWASVRAPLSPERERALTDAATFVALHLVRHRLAADMDGFEAQLLAAVLQGGPLAADAARRLGLAGDACWVVAVGGGAAAIDQVRLARARDLLALNLSGVARGTVTGVVAGTVYAVVPARGRPERLPGPIREALQSFVARARRLLGTPVVAAIGTRADSLSTVPEARDSAERALRALGAASGPRLVAEFGEVQAEALLLRFAETCQGDASLRDGPLAKLREHDRRRGTALVETLRAYLNAFGDVGAVARQMGVHPNTVRYRLRQMQGVGAFDLADPTQRLALILQVNLPVASS
jgi:hypothetical protein